MVEYLGDGSAKWPPPVVGSIRPVRHRVGSLETPRARDSAGELGSSSSDGRWRRGGFGRPLGIPAGELPQRCPRRRGGSSRARASGTSRRSRSSHGDDGPAVARATASDAAARSRRPPRGSNTVRLGRYILSAKAGGWGRKSAQASDVGVARFASLRGCSMLSITAPKGARCGHFAAAG